MTNEEIEKLKKRVAKDPKSKLFVPLAEAYKKRDMIDEAIDVLLKGLGAQPDYTSAGVALGKIYLDKEMLSEARAEFEKVVKQIPDNLLAHKRLAYIYREQGEYDMAVQKYQIVLELSPNDIEAAEVLSLLRSGTREPEETSELSKGGPERPEKTSEARPAREKTATPPVYEINEEIDGSELGIAIPDKLEPVSEGPVSAELEEYRSAVTKQNEDVTAEISNGGFGKGHSDKIVISMPTSTMADIFVTQGLYDKAMNVYKEMLSSDPANRHLLQRRKELEMLIKLKEKQDRG